MHIVIRCFGHVEKMNFGILTPQIHRAKVREFFVDGRGRLRRTYLNLIRGVLKTRLVESTKNKQACMKRLMEEVTDRSVAGKSSWSLSTAVGDSAMMRINKKITFK